MKFTRGILTIGITALFLFLLSGCVSTDTTPASPPKDPLERQDYVFGHQWVPGMVFRKPDFFRYLLSSEASEEAINHYSESLEDLWVELAKRLGATDNNIPSSKGLKAERVQLENKFSAIIITFPKPKEAPQNHFSAIVVDKGNSVRYITYEKTTALEALGIDQSPAAVLCEWFSAGKRANYGLIGEPSKAYFIDLLNQLLSKDLEPAARTNIPGRE